MDIVPTRSAAPVSPGDLAERLRTRRRCALGASGSAAVVVAVLVSAAATSSHLGAPACWPWLLTGLQVTALWAAGGPRWWGWLLGASVQPPWIAYALVTDQLGFVPGCLVSGSVQALSFLRSVRPEEES
ncbi:hypothetical protein [Isoptericola sediminis]|uniref:Uncharacterized protein n=1 Tax=Isoptericola sediminis TaxID=2733572 RepID=A0A849KF70_9MICO|nr:hypothetical protein [Isoptericola sediminis]NNU27213.1 hypothetical protein [Isoptericola sediminis]